MVWTYNQIHNEEHGHKTYMSSKYLSGNKDQQNNKSNVFFLFLTFAIHHALLYRTNVQIIAHRSDT